MARLPQMQSVPLLSIFTFTVLVGLGCLGSGSAARLSRKITTESWQITDTLSLRNGTSLRFPSLALRDRTFVVAGNLFVHVDSALPDPPAILFQVDSQQRPSLPPGDFYFAYPKGAYDSGGSYHLIWGQPSNGAKSSMRWHELNVSSLWYATFNKVEWSRPEQVFTGRRVFPDLTIEFTIGPDDIPRVLFGAIPREGNLPRLFYGHRETDGWKVTPLPGFRPSAWGALWTQPNATYVVGITSHDGYDQLATARVDEAGEVSEPIVAVAGLRDPDRPRAVRFGIDSVAILWTEGTFLGENTLHAVIAGPDLAWQRQQPIPLRGGVFVALLTTSHPCGGLVAIVEQYDTAGWSLTEIRYADQTAISERLFPGYKHAGAAGISDDGSVLVWSGSAADELPRAFVARRAQCHYPLPRRGSSLPGSSGRSRK